MVSRLRPAAAARSSAAAAPRWSSAGSRRAAARLAPGAEELQEGLRPENKATDVFWGHGVSDPVVRFACAEAGDALLSEMGVPCRLRAYPGMEHSACPEELDDLQDFLRERLLP